MPDCFVGAFLHMVALCARACKGEGGRFGGIRHTVAVLQKDWGMHAIDFPGPSYGGSGAYADRVGSDLFPF